MMRVKNSWLSVALLHCRR